MGLFDSIGSVAGTVGNAVATGIGGVPYMAGKALLGGGGGGGSSSSSSADQIDPRLRKMQDQQTQNAIDFGNNLPAYEEQQQRLAADSSRQQLAQQLAGVKANSNSRGMLYGSYNQGRQAQTTAQNAAALQTAKANINTQAQNTLNQMQGQALGEGVAVQQSQQYANQTAYQQALAQQLANNQLFGTLLGGAGMGAGLLLAAG